VIERGPAGEVDEDWLILKNINPKTKNKLMRDKIITVFATGEVFVIT
jgi:hypothetical protein